MNSNKTIIQTSTITCPRCGKQTTESMAKDSCQFFWKCPHCSTVLQPEKGDCCVFCSYGSVNCPPMQTNTEN